MILLYAVGAVLLYLYVVAPLLCVVIALVVHYVGWICSMVININNKQRKDNDED